MAEGLRGLRKRLQSRELALTSVAASDQEGLETVARALRQGRDELFEWGVGPSLPRGALVGLYVPGSVPAEFAPLRRIRGAVTNLYRVARETTEEEGFPWNQVVWLEGRVSLPSPVTVKALDSGGILRPEYYVPRYLQRLGLSSIRCGRMRRRGSGTTRWSAMRPTRI